jgi:hypothetical protein
MTVNQVMHALDNSTPYPVELTSDVLRYMAERMLEMTEMRKKAGHEVWQEDETGGPVGVGPEPTPLW